MMPDCSVLLTGASGALGSALVLEGLRRGWSIIAVGRQPMEEALVGQDGLTWIECDIARDDAHLVMSTALTRIGLPIDVVVNGAGMAGKATHLSDTRSDELLALFKLHVIGAMVVSRAALPHMSRDRTPAIINISSRLGSMAATARHDFKSLEMSYAYRITKAALNMLTLAMGEDSELAGIKTLAVHPGEFASRLARRNSRAPSEFASLLADFIERREDVQADVFHSLNGHVLAW